jgi:hypothetical protein
MRSWDDLDPWEVLGVSPGASAAEIRQAWDRIETALTPGSLAVYSILDAEEQAGLLRQARIAYQRLLRAAGAPEPAVITLPVAPGEATRTVSPSVVAEAPPPSRRPGPPPILTEIGPDREITGDLLREVREAWGLTLEAVAKRTRIMGSQLTAIEREEFAALPARVYTRGFVMSYARELGLDADHVWRCFELRWQASAPIPRPGLPRM